MKCAARRQLSFRRFVAPSQKELRCSVANVEFLKDFYKLCKLWRDLQYYSRASSLSKRLQGLDFQGPQNGQGIWGFKRFFNGFQGLLRVSKGSRPMQGSPRAPKRAPKGFQELQRVSKGSQEFSRAPKSFQGLSRVSKSSQEFLRAPKVFQELSRVAKRPQGFPRAPKIFQGPPKGSKRLIEAPKYSKKAPKGCQELPSALKCSKGLSRVSKGFEIPSRFPNNKCNLTTFRTFCLKLQIFKNGHFSASSNYSILH